MLPEENEAASPITTPSPAVRPHAHRRSLRPALVAGLFLAILVVASLFPPFNAYADPGRAIRPQSAIHVTGSITSTDPTEKGRPFRDAIASICSSPKPTLAAEPGTYHYDRYTYTNTGTTSSCVTATLSAACAGPNFIFAAAYLGSFDPANIAANYLADPGVSPTGGPVSFSFTLDAGQSAVIVVNEVQSGAGCTSYTLDVGPPRFDVYLPLVVHS